MVKLVSRALFALGILESVRVPLHGQPEDGFRVDIKMLLCFAEISRCGYGCVLCSSVELLQKKLSHRNPITKAGSKNVSNIYLTLRGNFCFIFLSFNRTSLYIILVVLGYGIFFIYLN